MKLRLRILTLITLILTMLGVLNVRADAQVESLSPLEMHVLYDANGHFYAVYMAAHIANKGGKAHYNKEALAFYSELPDKLKATTAFYAGPPIFEAFCNLLSAGHLFPYFDHIQRRVHSLSGGKAVDRQSSLAGLIAQEVQISRDDVPWRLGFLIHAYGDAFAHSFVDPRTRMRVLYEAPLGHLFRAHAPDQVSSNIALFKDYFRNLVQLLNDGPLTDVQSNEVEQWLASVEKQFSEAAAHGALSESDIFKKLVDPSNHYNPDECPWKGEFYRCSFMKLPLNRLPYPVRLPSRTEVKDLLTDIGNACRR